MRYISKPCITVLHGSVNNFSYIQLEEQKEEDHPELLYKDLYLINSKHFVEFTLTSKLSEFRKQKELKKDDLIFVEYKFKPKRAKICDVILKNKVSWQSINKTWDIYLNYYVIMIL